MTFNSSLTGAKMTDQALGRRVYIPLKLTLCTGVVVKLNNETEKNLFVGQSKNSKSPFNIEDAYIDQALGPWDQRPVFKTNVTQFTSLRIVNPQVPKDVLRKIIEYFPDAHQEFSLDPSFEDTNSQDIEHTVIKPYAKPENVTIFKNLQKFQSVGLIVPVDADYMYFAAMNSKSCRLTALGYHYWRLVKEKKI